MLHVVLKCITSISHLNKVLVSQSAVVAKIVNATVQAYINSYLEDVLALYVILQFVMFSDIKLGMDNKLSLGQWLGVEFGYLCL